MTSQKTFSKLAKSKQRRGETALAGAGSADDANFFVRRNVHVDIAQDIVNAIVAEVDIFECDWVILEEVFFFRRFNVWSP